MSEELKKETITVILDLLLKTKTQKKLKTWAGKPYDNREDIAFKKLCFS